MDLAGMEKMIIPKSTTWAVFPNVVEAWKRLYIEWLPTSGYELEDLPCIECYYAPGHNPGEDYGFQLKLIDPRREENILNNIKSDYLNINNGRLSYSVKGEGEPLILIHGNFNDSRIWDYQVDYFSDYYKVIWYDQRGYGKSDTPTSVFSHYEDLKALFDQLGSGNTFFRLNIGRKPGKRSLRLLEHKRIFTVGTLNWLCLINLLPESD
nr:alpha/beta fold hydrolase [Pseudobacteroides cellulosolvens]